MNTTALPIESKSSRLLPAAARGESPKFDTELRRLPFSDFPKHSGAVAGEQGFAPD